MNDDLLQRLERRRHAVHTVQEMLVERLYLEVDPDDLDPDAPLFGSGHSLDSIDAVELLVAIEDRFGLRLEDERTHAVRHLRTVHTIVDRILAGDP